MLETAVNQNIHFEPNRVYFYFNMESNMKERLSCYEQLLNIEGHYRVYQGPLIII